MSPDEFNAEMNSIPAEIDTVTITIHADGDPDAGRPSCTWEITDLPAPEDDGHREEIRSVFQDAFGITTGDMVRIVFSDELPDNQDGEIST